MKLQLDVKVELKDKNGHVIKTINKRCHSYVRQLIDFLCMWATGTNGNVMDTNEASQTFNHDYAGQYFRIMRIDAPSAVKDYGIQAGIGTTAPTISDMHLETIIDHGDTSGKLNYGATSVGNVAIVGSTAKFTIARTLTNNSGDDIDVKEVALTIASRYSVPNDIWVMIERTLLNFTITDGVSGTVTYTISITV